MFRNELWTSLLHCYILFRNKWNEWNRPSVRTAIGLFHLFHSFSVHFRVFLIYFNCYICFCYGEKNVPKKNLRGFCAVSTGEEAKNRFSRWLPWQPSWISDRNDFSYLIFDLQVTPMLPTMFGVNWLLGSGEEAKNRFSKWLPWWPSWISDRHDFSYFWSTSHPDAS